MRKNPHLIPRFQKSYSSTEARYARANHGYICHRVHCSHTASSVNNLMSIPLVELLCRRLGGHQKVGGDQKDTRKSSDGRRKLLLAKRDSLPVLRVESGACKGIASETNFSVACVEQLCDSPSQYVMPSTRYVAVMRNRTGCTRHQE